MTMDGTDKSRCAALIRSARKRGAVSIRVFEYPFNGERIDEGDTDEALLDAMLACDECIVECRGPGIRTNFLIVLGNGDDGPIADFHDTPFGNAVFNEVQPV